MIYLLGEFDSRFHHVLPAIEADAEKKAGEPHTVIFLGDVEVQRHHQGPYGRVRSDRGRLGFQNHEESYEGEGGQRTQVSRSDHRQNLDRAGQAARLDGRSP